MLHITDSLLQLTDSVVVNNSAVQAGGVVFWNSSAVIPNTLIQGNTFDDNSAIAGGILFLASLFSSQKKSFINASTNASIIYMPIDMETSLPTYWPDMMDANDRHNRASYGPQKASGGKTLTCLITSANLSGCADFSSRDKAGSGNFYKDENLNVSGSQVVCCIFDMFNQTLRDWFVGLQLGCVCYKD